MAGRVVPTGVLILILFSAFAVAPTIAAPEDANKEWVISTHKEFDNVAAMIRVESLETNQCTIRVELAGYSYLSRALMILIEDDDGNPVSEFFLQGSGSPIHAHISGVVSTHNLIGLSPWRTSITTSLAFTGGLDILAVGHGLSPNQFADHSIEYRIDCDYGVALQIHGDIAPHLTTPVTDDSGVGIWTAWADGPLIGAHAFPQYDAPDVRFRAFVLGAQITLIDLAHPEGEEQWLHGPDDDYSLFQHEGGPGEYGLMINRVAYDYGAWYWSYLIGLHPVESLEAIQDLPMPGNGSPLP